MISASLHKAEDGRLDYNDLLRFMNVKIDPLPPAAPVNVKVCYISLYKKYNVIHRYILLSIILLY